MGKYVLAEVIFKCGTENKANNIAHTLSIGIGRGNVLWKRHFLLTLGKNLTGVRPSPFTRTLVWFVNILGESFLS